MVTTLVVAVPMVTVLLIQGIVGYILARPPVTYSATFWRR